MNANEQICETQEVCSADILAQNADDWCSEKQNKILIFLVLNFFVHDRAEHHL